LEREEDIWRERERERERLGGRWGRERGGREYFMLT